MPSLDAIYTSMESIIRHYVGKATIPLTCCHAAQQPRDGLLDFAAYLIYSFAGTMTWLLCPLLLLQQRKATREYIRPCQSQQNAERLTGASRAKRR